MGIEHEQTNAALTRRDLLVKMGAGLVALTVSSAWGLISPAQARARGAPLRHLTAEEAQTLEALGEVLLPGAREAGLAHYIDDQLGRDAPLLILTVLDYPEPFTDFYKQGLLALNRFSFVKYDQAFGKCAPEQQTALARELSLKSPVGWGGPPVRLFYFAVRNDAIDVCYGTPESFAKLEVPYMAHIMPPQPW
jgi:hypothetical protein